MRPSNAGRNEIIEIAATLAVKVWAGYVPRYGTLAQVLHDMGLAAHLFLQL